MPPVDQPVQHPEPLLVPPPVKGAQVPLADGLVARTWHFTFGDGIHPSMLLRGSRGTGISYVRGIDLAVTARYRLAA
ncbi:MAG: hypothetical protein AB7N70_13545 [Dehalococcoidia bacterium]